jgi:hypothetical protein
VLPQSLYAYLSAAREGKLTKVILVDIKINLFVPMTKILYKVICLSMSFAQMLYK